MRTISYQTYLDKVYGCFIGKAISGNIGAPHEGVKMPLELPFMPEMIDCSRPNDDLDLQILWLDVIEKKGEHFTSYDLLDRFVNYCSYSPGEYAVMRKNYNRGVYPPYSGKFCNDYYTEGMGCPIRSELWGCVSVGNTALASEFASRDGCLDHYGESIWAERFLAALESEAFFESDLDTLIDKALTVLPPDSRFRELVGYTRALCSKYDDIKVVLTKLLFRYGHPDCTNMYQNMGITLAALLLGDSDIIKTSLLALNCGFDTDCTCATAGAIIGLLRGADELIRAYGLTEITYTLGVRSNRRSNKIFDLAEDIAAMGIQFTRTVNSGVVIENAPEVHFDFEPLAPLTVHADYPDRNPAIALGESREVYLTFENRSDTPRTLDCRLNGDHTDSIVCASPSFTAFVPAHGSARVAVTFVLPSDAPYVYDRNLFTLTAEENGETVLTWKFGLVGATPWKLSGPFWRTEPICTTEDILANFSERHPYNTVIGRSSIPGNWTDKTRHFHLNFATDTQTEYIGENELFERLKDDRASRVYEQSLANVREDSFRLDDFFGFRGPCVTYFSRILMAGADADICIQIGHTCPFKLYVNGECVAERDFCDNWTAENVHLDKIHLKKGENRIVFRVTRVNDDAKFNVTLAKGMACAEHHVCFCSKNPYLW